MTIVQETSTLLVQILMYGIDSCMQRACVCKVLVYAKCLCMQNACVCKVLVYAKCLCMQRACVCKVLVYAKSLCMHSVCVCKVLAYAKCLCMQSACVCKAIVDSFVGRHLVHCLLIFVESLEASTRQQQQQRPPPVPDQWNDREQHRRNGPSDVMQTEQLPVQSEQRRPPLQTPPVEGGSPSCPHHPLVLLSGGSPFSIVHLRRSRLLLVVSITVEEERLPLLINRLERCRPCP